MLTGTDNNRLGQKDIRIETLTHNGREAITATSVLLASEIYIVRLVSV